MYKLADPPTSLDFRGMTKRELRAYGDWFHRVLPYRIEEMTGDIRHQCPQWHADFLPASLGAVGAWLGATASSCGEEEVQVGEAAGQPVTVKSPLLTEDTVSRAIDAGMYFGSVLVRNTPGTRWHQTFRRKLDEHYGQPIVVGTTPLVLNPVGIMTTCAYKAARREPLDLLGLYQRWVVLLVGRHPGSKV